MPLLDFEEINKEDQHDLLMEWFLETEFQESHMSKDEGFVISSLIDKEWDETWEEEKRLILQEAQYDYLFGTH